MFSSRFKWSLETNHLTQLIEEKKRNGTPIIDLTETNPTAAGFTLTLPFEINQETFIYRADPRGLLRTREAVAKYYSDSRAQIISPDQIFLTASTSEAYSWLFKLLCDQNDEVLIPQPSYPLFEFLAENGIQLFSGRKADQYSIVFFLINSHTTYRDGRDASLFYGIF